MNQNLSQNIQHLNVSNGINSNISNIGSHITPSHVTNGNEHVFNGHTLAGMQTVNRVNRQNGSFNRARGRARAYGHTPNGHNNNHTYDQYSNGNHNGYNQYRDTRNFQQNGSNPRG